MKYDVIHGIDRVVDHPRNARECLELVKIVEAEAEPDIRILDPDGAEIRLGALEKRQREEIEREHVAVAAHIQPSSDARAAPLPPAAGVANRLGIAGLATMAAVLLVGALVWQVGARQTVQSDSRATRLETTPVSPAEMKSPEMAGYNAAKQAEKNESSEMRRPAQKTASYMVVAGDTHRSIAKKVYHEARRWRDIAAVNPRLDPRHLHPREKINLPQSVRAAMPLR